MPGPFYFAYAGGVIEPQVTVITNGTTHGAQLTTIAIVGDVNTGGRQLINLATNRDLETGALYKLAGPGIPAGTYFLNDNSILSGLANSLNLSAAATASANSATFTGTQAISVGVALATLIDGSAAVTLTDTGGLPAGTYGARSVGIGETDVPIATTDGTSATTGGGVMFIGFAYLVYDGAGGGHLAILAATPHTTTGLDEFGQVTNITTYTIAEQPVRAVSSGVFPMELDGFPTGDPAIITGVPSAAFLDLVPGLRYNISGNGIPLGATFIAPSSGTSLALDVDATASNINAILTITGPRVPNAASFNPLAHNLFDEEITSIEIAQEEGGFATLTIDIKNPNVGLLATGRNLWCWLSWDQAWTGGVATPDLVPLFNGRLIGVPKLQAGEIVQLQFMARPEDLNSQKSALIAALSVPPYYDPIWLASNVSGDTVLETYSSLWHIDRTSLQLTASDIIDGEAGLIDIGEDKSIYDRFSLSYGQPPLVAVTVSGTVSWQQQAEGMLDITQSILDAFAAQGSGYTHTFAKSKFPGVNPFPNAIQQVIFSTVAVGGGGLVQALMGDGLKNDWPKPGISIGGGWSFSTQNDSGGVPVCYIVEATKTATGAGWLTPAMYTVTYSAPIPIDPGAASFSLSHGQFVTQQYGTFTVDFPLNAYKIRSNLEYRADRKRTETVTAVVAASVQRELSDSAESDRETIALTSEFVGQGVDPDGALPIGNLAHRSYFQSDRGAVSVEYLLLAARAKIRARARAVDIGFAVDWRTALPITLRHNVRYTDRRLPGGVATGKVKSYRLSAGEAGMFGEFVIGCTIGTAEASVAQPGVNSYVNAGYANSGYQAVTGQQNALLELAYETLDNFVISDDGLDLTNVTVPTALNACFVVNGLTTQLTALSRFQNTVAPTGGDPASEMKKLTTTVTIDLKPVTGTEFHTDFTPAVTPLALPKTIDLAAP